MTYVSYSQTAVNTKISIVALDLRSHETSQDTISFIISLTLFGFGTVRTTKRLASNNWQIGASLAIDGLGRTDYVYYLV